MRVVILAYDVSDMTTLLSAHELALHLGLQQLSFNRNELLATSKIAADN